MPPVPPTELSDKDKLEILQRFDRFRKWRSLDDKRYCLACAKIMSGREIQVVGGTGNSGPLRVVCPTLDCDSIPLDWALPTSEVLAKLVNDSAEQHIPLAGKAYSAGERTQRNGDHPDSD